MKKLLIVFFTLSVMPLFSHGAEYSILSDRVIKIEAKFDTGEAFSNSEVLVFPPNSSEVAYSLTTDIDGIFYLKPDIIGIWILQVRGVDGHGLRINLPITESGISSDVISGHVTLIQKLLMVFCVAWGAIGTALYFSRRGR